MSTGKWRMRPMRMMGGLTPELSRSVAAERRQDANIAEGLHPGATPTFINRTASGSKPVVEF